jgi:hypothetical protein
MSLSEDFASSSEESPLFLRLAAALLCLGAGLAGSAGSFLFLGFYEDLEAA